MLSEEQIEEINKKHLYLESDLDQGIFKEPFGIPDGVKEQVVYCRWAKSGAEGGNCYGGDARHFERQRPKNAMSILDDILQILYPDITYLNFKQLEKEVKSNEKTLWEYYGNYDDYVIEYIELPKLYELIKKFKGN